MATRHSRDHVVSPRTGAYDFPTRQVSPIAGLAFYNEHVDLYLDGQLLPRPAPITRAIREREHPM
ncbi:hypothetical protein GCM10020367_69860 [Streptomyces sannanensis]|uniref:Uncharacterized protein n=1 Tax=Streptomyces sannanensis TaxID=285536 RepID=A0ABP6SNB7_9ACTN